MTQHVESFLKYSVRASLEATPPQTRALRYHGAPALRAQGEAGSERGNTDSPRPPNKEKEGTLRGRHGRRIGTCDFFADARGSKERKPKEEHSTPPTPLPSEMSISLKKFTGKSEFLAKDNDVLGAKIGKLSSSAAGTLEASLPEGLVAKIGFTDKTLQSVRSVPSLWATHVANDLMPTAACSPASWVSSRPPDFLCSRALINLRALHLDSTTLQVKDKPTSTTPAGVTIEIAKPGAITPPFQFTRRLCVLNDERLRTCLFVRPHVTNCARRGPQGGPCFL